MYYKYCRLHHEFYNGHNINPFHFSQMANFLNQLPLELYNQSEYFSYVYKCGVGPSTFCVSLLSVVNLISSLYIYIYRTPLCPHSKSGYRQIINPNRKCASTKATPRIHCSIVSSFNLLVLFHIYTSFVIHTKTHSYTYTIQHKHT